MAASIDHPVSLQSLTPQPFVFFASDDHRFWRYLWPFLSARQLTAALALIVMAAIVCLKVLPESFGADERMTVFFCVTLMLIRQLHEQLPGKITIAATRGQAEHLIPLLTHLFTDFGLARTCLPPHGDPILFRPTWDAWWFWLHAPRPDIVVSIAADNIIEVRGPKETLDTLRWKLRWKLDESRLG